MRPNNKAYKAVFEYLVNNHDVNNPAQPSDIADATGVSRSSVYRLLTKRVNGAPDETVSAGIFVAPETFSIHGYKPVTLYYADPKRIKDTDAINELVASTVSLPFAWQYFLVQPVVLTPSLLRLITQQRNSVNSVLDSTKPWPDIVGAINTAQTQHYKEMPVSYSNVSELFVKCREHCERVTNGEETLNKELLTEYTEAVVDVAETLTTQLEMLKTLIAHPSFDSATYRLFADDAKKSEIAPPMIRERK